MKTIIRYISILIICALYVTAPAVLSAQDKGHTSLNPGDKMPDVPFHITNYKTPTAKISDFKGKLVILDLWAVTCGSCIKAMPHMQELQKRFGDSIQIIMVTRDEAAKVKKLALRSDNVRNNKLPSVMGDSIAYLFDYQVVPTHIWIDQSGVIRFIASGSDATKKNISSFLAGKDIALKQKIDIQIDGSQPSLVSWYPYYDSIGIYSYLAPAQNIFATSGGVGFSMKRDKQKAIKRLSLGRASLVQLYKVAYGNYANMFNYSDSRFFIKAKNKSAFNVDYKSGKNFYTYDLICNVSRPDNKVYHYMQQQLDLYFDLDSYLERKNLPCLVIRRRNDKDFGYVTKGGHVKGDRNKGVYKVQNVPWSTVIDNISKSSYAAYQVIDETGIASSTKIDIIFNLNHWDNLSLLNKELVPYGLVVSKEQRKLDCIVIEDAKE